MKKLSFGDIVLLRFPYSSVADSKKRPAFVIQDTDDGDVIVCRITSKIYNSKYDFYIERWAGLGLKLSSVIRLHKIATLEKSMVEKVIGSFGHTEKQAISDILADLITKFNE